ncbi:unnamed protein product [Lymnaea stagnalis]|uniref:Thioredoxin domain-containing protein n=1 Tax=Lymnaea stagnalis TaxID=6523 RepID=A0AAV2H3L7_LYMST
MFTPSSYVLDSPRGSLIPLIQLLHEHEFVFVMYYAPWCYKSQAARAEFLKAANFFKGEVHFAAVNCWWPEGECKKRYKFLMFPVFLAYHTRLDGYRFFGHARAEHMIKFIENLIRPLQIMHSTTGIIELISQHENIILGYFNLSLPNSTDAYNQFYYASMRILERDPFQPIKFAVVTQPEVAKEYFLSNYEDIIMVRLTNSSLFYPYGKNITSSNLLTWAIQNKGKEIVKRLSPEGLKSQTLEFEMDKGPAFILFHLENPLFNIEHGLRVLKDVVLTYRQCMLETPFHGIRSVWTKIIARDIKRYHSLTYMCDQLKHVHRPNERSCCISAVIKHLDVNGKVFNICYHSLGTSNCNLLLKHFPVALKHVGSFSSSCRHILLSYIFAAQLSICCQQEEESLSASANWVKPPSNEKWVLNISNDDHTVYFVKENVSADSEMRHSNDRFVRDHLEHLPRRLCDRLLLEKQQGVKSSSHDVDLEFSDSISLEDRTKQLTQVGCTSNKTLNFYTMDSKNRWMFSDALGIEPSAAINGPTAVLFDKENEEHYIMKENFTYSNTMSFIIDFEHGRLKRHLQSHSFRQNDYAAPGHVNVKELDSQTFLDVVKPYNKDIVVLIYAHWCGFCQTLSHTFLSLAQYFSTSPHIVFSRINGATNDLPWEYTFDSYPTVIFFPARQKSDSILFPKEKEKSLTNLVRFVLHHATHDTKLHLAADVCSTSCIKSNIQRCTSLLQELRLRQARLQRRLSAAISSNRGDNYFNKLGSDYIVSQLQSVRTQVLTVEKLRAFLEQQGESINKQELFELFSVAKNSFV